MADAHEVAIGHIIVRKKRKNIHIDDLRAHDHRLARIVVQRVQTLFVTLRQLELQPGGGIRHFAFQIAPHGTQVSLEHRDDHIDQLCVLRFALLPDAGALAVAQMILQANRIPAFGDLFGRQIELARPQRHHFAHEFEHAVLHHHRTVGTEILRTVARQLSGGLHARKMLAPHHDPRIGLVVLEQDVVTRLEGLYQRIFEQQRVGLAVDDDMADLGDLPHQHTHFGAVLLALHEIGGDPFAQALGLTHIDNRSGAVHELVDARRQRQHRHLLFKVVFSGFGHNDNSNANVANISQNPQMHP